MSLWEPLLEVINSHLPLLVATWLVAWWIVASSLASVAAEARGLQWSTLVAAAAAATAVMLVVLLASTLAV